MQILEHRALRGPNLYSRFPAIYMLLDIGPLEDRPSDLLPGFTQRLLTLLPSLREHRCSPGYVGGFVERLERGTWAGHIVEHVTIELQCLAGMDVGFGKTRETAQKGVYSIVYRYRDEEAGVQAGEDAVAIVHALAHNQPVDLPPLIQRLKEIREDNLFGPSTGSIVREAKNRGIPVLRLNKASFVQLGHGRWQKRIQATMTAETSALGVEITDDKDRTKRVLDEAGIPVPRGTTCAGWEEVKEAVTWLGYPLVMKPLVGNHGKGITVNLQNETDLKAAYDAALKFYETVVVEKFLTGHDHRMLVIGGKFVAAARRDPAQIVGDGRSTVQQLIDQVNLDPRRGFGHEKVLTRIHVDEMTLRILAHRQIGLGDVLPAGEVLALKSTANLSTGGTAKDVTDEVHPQVRFMAERISRIVNLDIMGVDVVAPHLREPLHLTGGGVVEVNAAPGFRMHLEPAEGKPRPVAGHVLDMLFPPGAPSTIPLIAITGTNGKTTTVRLVAHILKYAGAKVGVASTDGIVIENHLVVPGDYSGPEGARFVLREATVDHAVLEVARGGILRRGLGFDTCHVGALLNVASDHLGTGGINTLDELAEVKGIVVETAAANGFAVLNAEDPRVVTYRKRVRAKPILFSRDPQNAELLSHLDEGGTGVTVNAGMIVVRSPALDSHVVRVLDVPLTLEGRASFNVANVLAAVAICHALQVDLEDIQVGLVTFNPTFGQNPGRMNLMNVGKVRVMVDYGHNVPALAALAEVIPHLTSGRRINVASGAGNRRDEDLREFGATLAGMYDRLYICDPDPRGRPPGETAERIREGAASAGGGDKTTIVLDELAAVEAAFQEAKDGDLIVLQVDQVQKVIRNVMERKAKTEGHPSY